MYNWAAQDTKNCEVLFYGSGFVKYFVFSDTLDGGSLYHQMLFMQLRKIVPRLRYFVDLSDWQYIGTFAEHLCNDMLGYPLFMFSENVDFLVVSDMKIRVERR